MRTLGPNDVEVWVTRPSSVMGEELQARFRSWLAPDEAARHGKFRFDRHRHEYLVTRGLVRTALSAYRAIEPPAWTFRANAYGRPEIVPSCDLAFNLSNTQSMVVCAVAERRRLGVDVEPIDRAPDILDVADTVFCREELVALRALPAAAARDRAVSLWTAKEAYMKARGLGMSLPPRQIAVRFARTPTLVAAPDEDHAADWTLSFVDLDGHRIALASLGPAPRIALIYPTWEQALGPG